MKHIGEVMMGMDKYADVIPAPRFGPDGMELFSSRVRRAVSAYRLESAAGFPSRGDCAPPTAEGRAKQREESIRRSEEGLWSHAHHALRAMGLMDKELNDLAAMDPEWPAVVAAKEWWHTPKEGTRNFLTIGGPTNVGKTIAAASLLFEQKALYEGSSYVGWQWETGRARFVKVAALARLRAFDKEDAKQLDSMSWRKFLIIDDLGAESKNDWFVSTLLGIIDARLRANLRTVITTNLTSKEFQAEYDSRIWRRLSEGGQMVGAKRP